MDHKLKIFREVALSGSFTKAAENLFISQPAVSKTIKLLEQEYGKAFFLRKGNTIELTAEGNIFLSYARKILKLHAEMANEFSSESGTLPNQIKLGASTTIMQYVIPKIVAKIQKEKPEVFFQVVSGNTEEIQKQILNGQLDFAIVEGHNHNSRLKYEPFVKDELVLVTNFNNKTIKTDSISLEKISELSFVQRESGSGTKEVISNALKQRKITPLKNATILGSTESIKTYLQNSDYFGLLSVHAVSQELLDSRLKIIEVKGFKIERWFYFVSRQGFQSKTIQKLKKLFLNGYNQK